MDLWALSRQDAGPTQPLSHPTPAGRRVLPPAGTSWRFNRHRFAALVADNRIYFGPAGNNIPRYKRFLNEVPAGLVPTTLWLREEVGDNQQAKAEACALCPADPFATPKPERLLERILTIASNPGDLILDCFASSGTTAAVAHKMRRPWVVPPHWQRYYRGPKRGPDGQPIPLDKRECMVRLVYTYVAGVSSRDSVPPTLHRATGKRPPRSRTRRARSKRTK